MTWIDHESVWEQKMHPSVPAHIAYPYVERMAREFLEQHRGATFSTVELVEHLYSGDNDQTDQRIFMALKALATRGLMGWWRSGEPYTTNGTVLFRKVWTAPEEKKCPHCGGKL